MKRRHAPTAADGSHKMSAAGGERAACGELADSTGSNRGNEVAGGAGGAGCRPRPGPEPRRKSWSLAMPDCWENPLVSRYASREMAELWGPQRKFSTWRRLWVALAEAEHELGLLGDDGVTPRIRPEQIAELRSRVDAIDFTRAD